MAGRLRPPGSAVHCTEASAHRIPHRQAPTVRQRQLLAIHSTALHAVRPQGCCSSPVLPLAHRGHVQHAHRQRVLRLRLSAIATTGGDGGGGSRNGSGSDASRRAAAKLIQRSSGSKPQPDDTIDVEAGASQQRAARRTTAPLIS
jgi:hypothetical protein